MGLRGYDFLWKQIDYPPTGANVTFKKAEKVEEEEVEAEGLPFMGGRK